MTSAAPARNFRSYLHVADTLRRAIPTLKVDDNGRLPSERELAALLKISRPSLREGLIALELRGEIEIRVGSGIYLRNIEAAPAQAAATPLGDSPHDVNQMRGFLEGGVAAYAALHITPGQLRQLRKSLQAMQRALRQPGKQRTQSITDADRQFHITLAETTGNALLLQTLGDLFDQRYSPVAQTMHKHFDDFDAWRVAVQEHQDIYEAVAARDPLQAMAAMQRHLMRAHGRLMTMIG
ncbi:FCD domain-containing protein [Pusillimonas sp. TS35]|uniref:FadR/GntR family transcriptional regulator n=1 Tax=Paracandidimonas lactea TaxID=2895524 RepID=UPI001370A575|nr:FadR/GntR family transcriptional regulator [Paracandidimonas lactea]MYN12413.1 FCD domain-containing protein [Pusillimonas sp. TS35]